jgi:hypothetical protein
VRARPALARLGTALPRPGARRDLQSTIRAGGTMRRAPARRRHVENGSGAFVPPGGLVQAADGGGTWSAAADVEVPGRASTLRAAFTLPVGAPRARSVAPGARGAGCSRRRARATPGARGGAAADGSTQLLASLA